MPCASKADCYACSSQADGGVEEGPAGHPCKAPLDEVGVRGWIACARGVRATGDAQPAPRRLAHAGTSRVAGRWRDIAGGFKSARAVATHICP